MASPVILLPDAMSLVAGHGRGGVLTRDGELLTVSEAEVAVLLREQGAPLVVHAPATFSRLGIKGGAAYDLLELFAFVMPARGVAPTPRGLALALDLGVPEGLEGGAAALPGIAEALLARLAAGASLARQAHAGSLAALMGAAGWGWAPMVLAALGQVGAKAGARGLRVWEDLPKWEEEAPLPAPGSMPVGAGEARARLAAMLGAGAEQRPGQADYASAAARAFAPREVAGEPHVVLAEAGTGTGKTLGYVAPASLWAERNGGAVWVSTFTRHLQRQVNGELARLYPDAEERRRRVVVRKGRENYLCLLNFQEIAGSLGVASATTVPLGLVARWAMATGDGDVSGGDLPGWFPELFGGRLIPNIADRRGECIHGACQHYRTCFVEHTVRRARGASLVVANHALVMAQAAWGGLEDADVPTRYVFDEGHHIFDAADSAFSAELSGTEAALMRRWLLGAEDGPGGKKGGRAKGLGPRLETMVGEHVNLVPLLPEALAAARVLPGAGWSGRLSGEASGVTERFLHAVRGQVLARAGVEGEMVAGLYPVTEGLAAAAGDLAAGLRGILVPLRGLVGALEEVLETKGEALESEERRRVEAAVRMIKRRAVERLGAWLAMLGAVGEAAPEPGVRPEHLYQVSVVKWEGRDGDAVLARHWLDPTIPFAAAVVGPAHGMVITSATLRDSGGEAEASWAAAEARVGASHLALPAVRVSVASPFDYGAQTRAFVVSDVGPDAASLAGAYRALFLASGGGGLGLFTAIKRLREVHGRIAGAMDEAGLMLLAQHVDAMDNATLVDVFRTEVDSCLLGTDAMRDGVDVPGRALRLVVFDRMPWPRPDLLHRERRVHLSGGDPRGYDDSKARLRLRQAFGRLVRTAGDRGVFVLLDRRAPSRLMSAFPAGVMVRRAGLAEVVGEVGAFLAG